MNTLHSEDKLFFQTFFTELGVLNHHLKRLPHYHLPTAQVTQAHTDKR